MKIINSIIAFLFVSVLCMAQAQISPGTGLDLDDDSGYEQMDELQADGSKVSLPPEVTLYPFCPTPRNQGRAQSCVGWATGYSALTIEKAIQYRLQNKERITKYAFSAMYIYNQIREGDCLRTGSRITDAMNFLEKNGNVMAGQFDINVEDCGRQATPDLQQEAQRFRISDYLKLFPVEENHAQKIFKVKYALSKMKPVVIGMKIRKNFFQIQNNAKFWWPEIGDRTPAGGHAMTVVAYDDRRGAFLLMNSWGQKWGLGGFIWVKYEVFAEYCKYAFIIQVEDSLDGFWDAAYEPETNAAQEFVQDPQRNPPPQQRPNYNRPPTNRPPARPTPPPTQVRRDNNRPPNAVASRPTTRPNNNSNTQPPVTRPNSNPTTQPPTTRPNKNPTTRPPVTRPANRPVTRPNNRPATIPVRKMAGSFDFRYNPSLNQYVSFFESAEVVSRGFYYQLKKQDWQVGQQFQLEVNNLEKNAYVYVFSVNNDGETYVHWPRKASLNPRFQNENNSALLLEDQSRIVVPGENRALKIASPGQDHLVILFSKKPIRGLPNLLELIEERAPNQSLPDKVMEVLGSYMVPLADVEYEREAVEFTVNTRSEGMIVPLIIEVNSVMK